MNLFQKIIIQIIKIIGMILSVKTGKIITNLSTSDNQRNNINNFIIE